MARQSWSKEETRILQEQWPVIGDPRDLALLIGRTYKAIKTRAKVLGLKRRVPCANFGRTKASAADDQYIKDHYLTVPVSQMAKEIGYSETLVKGRMRYMGLVVPKEIREKFSDMSRIKPGNVPKNKGKKLEEYCSPEMIERIKRTQYKKGQIPQNKAHYRDGDITIRLHKRTGVYYKWIRVAIRKWVMLHVYNWEQAKGPVPEGCIVVFRSKDTMDCSVENLDLITMKENMLRNSASLNLSDGYIANCLAWRDKETAEAVRQDKALIELKRQQLILKRTIHETSLT